MTPSRNRRRPWPSPDLQLWLSAAAVATAIGAAALAERRAATVRPASADRPFGVETPADEPMRVQYRRARQRGRGRHADAPWDIPWRGWRDILVRTYHQVAADRVLAIAAGVVFYGLLALFPAITALVSSYGMVATAADIGKHLAFVAGLIPGGAYDIVQDQVARIVSKSDGRLSLAFVFGLGLAIWSANAGMKAMIDALNVVYGETERRSFLMLNAISLAMTVGALAIFLCALGVVVVLPVVFNIVGLGGVSEQIFSMLRWPAMLILLIVTLGVLYRVGPSRRQPRWQWISVGSLAAAILWIAGSALFSFYLSRFANYDATYGSLGAAIGLMMWLWLTAIVVLLGAELNSEIEHQTARDSTVGQPKPIGARRAVMADTVGAAQT